MHFSTPIPRPLSPQAGKGEKPVTPRRRGGTTGWGQGATHAPCPARYAERAEFITRSSGITGKNAKSPALLRALRLCGEALLQNPAAAQGVLAACVARCSLNPCSSWVRVVSSTLATVVLMASAAACTSARSASSVSVPAA